MNNTKSVVLFGETIVLCREFIITTKLSIITNDVGDILMNVISSNRSCSNEVKKNIIRRLIILLNEYFVEKGDSCLGKVIGAHFTSIFCYTVLSILTTFCELIMPIIDYLEIDDRLLIHNDDWSCSLSKLYNTLRDLNIVKFIHFKKSNWKTLTNDYSTEYHVALLERYTLSKNHKVNSFYTPLTHIIKHNMENIFVPMRLNK